MSLQPKELGEIYAQIQSDFEHDPTVEILPSEGDPPSQYEVIYTVPCTATDENGEIAIVSSHEVIVSIPFGFPHFPPSCKPKSPIFHPDFDTAAICLGDFWHGDQTLSELIRHIRSMLQGEIYSTENAFNDEAAVWFTEHQDLLPFSLPEEEVTVPEPEIEDELSPDNDTLDDLQLDLIDDQEEEDFPFDDDLSDFPEEESSASIQENEELNDSSTLRFLAGQKKFFKLEAELSRFDQNTSDQNLRELFELTQTQLEEGRALHSKAGELEDQGNLKHALDLLRQVEDTIADFPYLEDDLKRLEQSLALLNEISSDQNNLVPQQAEPPESLPASSSAPETIEVIEEVIEPPIADKTPEPDVQGIEQEVQRKESKKVSHIPKINRTRIVGILGFALILLLGSGVGWKYFNEKGQLEKAQQQFNACTKALNSGKFKTAQMGCQSALSITQQSYLMNSSSATQLQQTIQTILSSKKLHQGLQGKVLYNDQYVLKETVSHRKKLDKELQAAIESVNNSQWLTASQSFNRAYTISKQLPDFQEESRLEFDQKSKLYLFKDTLSQAEKLVGQQNWPMALATLTKTKQQLAALTPKQQAEYVDHVTALRAESEFAQLKQQAGILFSQSDWAGAATLFEQAVKAGHALSKDTDLSSLEKNIARAELYGTINAGNQAFGAGDWDEAITQYRQARGLIDTNATKLNLPDTERSKQRIERIILQSLIIRSRQSADQHEKDGDYPAAIKEMEYISDLITQSDFADDPEFSVIVEQTLTSQKATKDRIFLEEKQQYLTDNYLDLFQENYQAANPDTMSDPKAEYIKRLENLYLFKLECTESGRGRPLKLIMYYTYNPDNGQWRFYSEN